MKVIDLRHSPSRAEGVPGVAVLNDAYLVRRESAKGNGLVALYGTSGSLDFQCISHPSGHIWGPYDSGHMTTNYAIAVDLSHLAENNIMRIVNRVTFTGAYDRTPKENFETHIERPTRSLTFVLLFSDDRPCLSMTGYTQVGRRGRLHPDQESRPIVLQGGALACWHILPKRGEWLSAEARFRIEWTWQPA